MFDVPDVQLDKHALNTQITMFLPLGRLGDIADVLPKMLPELYRRGAQLRGCLPVHAYMAMIQVYSNESLGRRDVYRVVAAARAGAPRER